VAFHPDGWSRLELPNDFDVVPAECGRIHAQGVLEKVGGRERFHDADHLRVVLLHADDVLDMIDIASQRFQFGEQALLFAGKVVRQRVEVGQNALTAGIRGEKSAEVPGMLMQQHAQLCHAADP